MSAESIELGRRVRAFRVLRGLRQDELARGAALARETVGRIERAVVRPHRVTLAAIARALGVRAGDLTAAAGSLPVLACRAAGFCPPNGSAKNATADPAGPAAMEIVDARDEHRSPR